MQPVPIHHRPVFPNAHILACRPVPTTRHVTQDAVEHQPTAAWAGLDARKDGCVEVGDHERRRGEAGGLVHQHVSSFVVAVIGNEETLREGSFECGVIGVKRFKELCGL